MRAPHQRLSATHTRTLITLLLFLSFLASPTFARSSDVTRCFNNLKNVDLAKKIVAHDRNLKTGDVIEPSWIQPELEAIRTCPSGGTYTIGPIGTPATCSITNHTPAEAERTFARWRREQRIYTAYGLAVMTASIGAPIVAVILAVRCYRRRKSLRSVADV